jgi:hypothetical protein
MIEDVPRATTESVENGGFHHADVAVTERLLPHVKPKIRPLLDRFEEDD